jgi:hypothetical protein
LYRTWLMASEKHGYTGLASDWETLVRRIGRGEINMEPPAFVPKGHPKNSPALQRRVPGRGE